MVGIQPNANQACVGDERKPRCGSCEERNVACNYPDLTFIMGPKLGAVQETSSPSSDQPTRPYSSVRVSQPLLYAMITTSMPCEE